MADDKLDPKDELCKDKFIEEGAFLEHKRWADWQEYLHSLCVKNEDGSLTIPKERVERWERQIKTTYTELTEEEKEFDRIEVRKYIPILISAGWVRKGDVEIDGDELALLLNDQNFIYENTDDDGFWMGKALSTNLSQSTDKILKWRKG